MTFLFLLDSWWSARGVLPRLLAATVIGMFVGSCAWAQQERKVDPIFVSASATGIDWKCPGFTANFPSVAAAIGALKAYTDGCPYLEVIHTDSCSGVPANTKSSGSCEYAGRKNTEGGGDNVGGTASWVFECPAGSTASGADCIATCPDGMRWVPQVQGCRPVVEREDPRPPQPPDHCTPHGPKPIYPLRGTERMSLDLPMSIGWQRMSLVYDTEPKLPPVAIDLNWLARQPLAFGELWLGNMNRRLVVEPGLKYARAIRGDGSVTNFVGNGSGNFTPEVGVNDSLLAMAGGGYRYIGASEGVIEAYDHDGVLTRIDRTDGRSLTFTYSTASTPPALAPAAGYLLNVADNFGRSVLFEYILPAGAAASNGGRVAKIIDPAGRFVAVAYDSVGNLSQLTWQDGHARQFLYENAAVPWALTGIVDENGTRYATIEYDGNGRAISSEFAGGIDRYSVTYTKPPTYSITETYSAADDVVYRTRTWQISVAPMVTMANGSTVDLGVGLVARQPRVTTRSQPAGSGCAASTSTLAYDTNGNVVLQDDFNGNRMCRSFDLSRNLEAVRVEGLPKTQSCAAVTAPGAGLPAGSRKITTQWHPDWRVSTKVAEPGRIITFVYNGQPDPFAGNAVASCAPSTAQLPDGQPIVVMCKRVEQATTDASGSLGLGAMLQAGVASRVQSWIYNAQGQVVTAKDALNNTTTYAYHADVASDHMPGDLASLTNAKGQIIQYTKYDRHGQVLEMVDPNGVITTNTYDPRQRLLSSNVAGEAVSYIYDPAGQLKRVTNPDGSWIGYDYDAAHRQVAVFDSRGNRIDYTLDKTGRRTMELVKDPMGVLSRAGARLYDALNRVKTVSGAVQ